jgi:transposase
VTPFRLNDRERQGLEDLMRQATEATALRRTQALLWLDGGESIQQIADRLRISRQAVYKWLAHFQARQACALQTRVAPGAHSGRPRTVHGVIEPLIDAVIDRKPRAWGYQATVWTAPLMVQYLAEVHQLRVSRPSVSLALGRLRMRWKRPRHQLARRSPTWRQAQGGSNAAWPPARARCS